MGVAGMKVSRFLIFSLVLGTLLMAASSIRSESEVGADLEVVSYGFPFFWLFHQITSIAGPVDVWSVELSMSSSGGLFPSLLSLHGESSVPSRLVSSERYLGSRGFEVK